MKNAVKVIALACSVVGLLWSSTNSNIIHVPSGQPSIQAGLNAASRGDTILVAPGIYHESLNWPSVDNVAVLSEEGAAVTVIDGGGSGTIQIVSGDSARIEGFSIRHFLYVTVISDAFNLWACVIESCSTGQSHGVLEMSDATEVKIVGNLFRDCKSDFGTVCLLYNAEALILENALVRNEIIQRPDDIGVIDLGWSSNQGPVRARIRNNVIYDNIGCGIVIADEDIKVKIVRNNIIVGNDYSGIRGNYVDEFDFNNVYGNAYDLEGWAGPNSISEDPLFVDPDGCDFHLAIGSPCIGAGKDYVDMGMHPGVDFFELPAEPKLLGPFNGNSNTLELRWYRSRDSDFFSYRLYQDTIATLDTASTLVAEYFSASDTTVVVSGLSQATGYFFKSYTFDSDGHFSSSRELLGFTSPIEYEYLKGWPQAVEDNFWGSSPTVGDVTDAEGLEIVCVGTDGGVYVWDKDGRMCHGWPQSIRSSSNMATPASADIDPLQQTLYVGTPAIADIDQNGRNEVIVLCHQLLHVWDAEGRPLAGWPVTVPGYAQFNSPALGDLDGDLDLEIVTVISGHGWISAYHHDGTLVTGWPKNATLGTASAALADLDGDGDCEVIVGGCKTPSTVYVWDGDGSNFPGWPQSTDGSCVVTTPACGDIDNDGETEIVVGAGYENKYLYAWNSDGSVLPGWPILLSERSVIHSFAAMGNVDEDEELEIAIGTDDTWLSTGVVYLIESDGQIVPGWPKLAATCIRSSPAIADIDGDGAKEVVCAAGDFLWGPPSLGLLYSWHADGNLLSSFPLLTPDPIGLSSVAIADIDDNGNIDIVAATYGGGLYIWNGKGDTSATDWASYQNDRWNTGSSTMPIAGGVIIGDVKSAFTGMTIQGVYTSAADEDTVIDDTTDINGKYLLSGLLPSVYDVHFSHPHFIDTAVAGIVVTSGGITHLNMLMRNAGRIAGRVISAETGCSLSGAFVEVLDGAWVVGSAHAVSDGMYSISYLPVDTLHVRCHKARYQSSIKQVRISGGQADTVDFQLNEVAGVDLAVDLWADGLPRWGFDHEYFAHYINHGTQKAAEIRGRMILDSLVSYISSNPPGFLDGNLVTWQFDSLASGGEIDVSVTVNIDTMEVPVDSRITTSSSISFAGEDVYTADDSVVIHEIVVNSWDPNDKLVYPTGIGPSGYIREEQRLNYTIFFENETTATAEAVNIWVVDSLDEDLNWNTFSVGPMSHADQCSVSFDSINGVLTWFCDSIMLPPNVNPPEGEGHVTFSVSPYCLAHGTEIRNRAAIRLDFNPWMVAPGGGAVVSTVDEFPPSSRVLPLEDCHSSENFLVQWEGSDDSLGFGSGISSYSVYVSDNGGSYEIWIHNALDSNSTYMGERGHTYCFYSIATDNVGNVESMPPGPDACTYVSLGVKDGRAQVSLPKDFSLSQNYPNPFNPTTEIRYALPRDCQVRLTIYNIIGRKVATLAEGKQKAGYKTARWDASPFSSGIYFYLLQAGDFVQTRKMILLK